jgi:hypothetical protein
MENVVIKVKTKSDSKFLSELAKKLGFDSFILSDFDKRYLARKKLTELTDTVNELDISEDEITEIVKPKPKTQPRTLNLKFET